MEGKTKAVFENTLEQHTELRERKKNSILRTQQVRTEFDKRFESKYEDLTIFFCGSLGRKDSGSNSDMDLFIFSQRSKNEIKRLDEIRLFNELISINDRLSFPEFSNDGMYLNIHSFPEMIDSIGEPRDDYENRFTTRMLMLLESECTWNSAVYDQQIARILDEYFRDGAGKANFKPLFLLNDILRFWRTLCLNYEIVRSDASRPFRKKNINLKFSRLLTIFGTVLPIVAKANSCDKEFLLGLTKKSPLERLAIGLDNIGDNSLLVGFNDFLTDYEYFLQLKESLKERKNVSPKEKEEIDERANGFSSFIYKALSHEKIDKEYKKYLML